MSKYIFYNQVKSQQSFNDIDAWVNKLKEKASPDIKIFLIGNKSDLEEERKVQLQEAKTFKEENGIHYFNEASAKSGINAKEVFIEAAKLLYSEHLKYKDKKMRKLLEDSTDIPAPIKVSKDINKRKKGGCCG